MNTRWQHVPLLALVASALIFAPASRAQGGYPQAQYDPNAQQQQPLDQGDPSQDPPSLVGRLSILQGNVSFQPQGVQDFSAAEINYPLTNGDRLYADSGALAEVQAGQLALRLGQLTDLTVTQLDAQYAQFGLASGSVHLRAFSLDPDSTAELDTPNASIVLTQPGDVRVDVSPDGNTTTISVLSGQVQITADGVNQALNANQGMQIIGAGPSSARMVGRLRPDALDSFSADRDRNYQTYFANDQNYVNGDTIGAADLGAYGDWGQDNDYGPVWYPRGVATDWAPYTNGHWVSVAPWGWTWVGYEPWGFAPFHYGRWAHMGNRWGWIPGSPVVHPIYSPALVAFVGGGGFSISVGGGAGVAAWFPLGPREVYRPWYRTSPVYVNRVNVSNIYSRNSADVRRIYGSRTNVYVNVNVNNYANRGVGTVAISARDFGSRRPVRDVRITGDQARRFDNAPVMNRPPVAAPSRPVAGPPVRNVPPRGAQRPVFDSQNPNRPSPNGPRPGNDNRPGGRPDNGNRPGQPNNGNGQPNNGNNNGRFDNGNRGNDGRFNNGGQPNNNNGAPVVRPGQPTNNQPPSNNQPGNNNGRDNRGNDGRFNNGSQPGNNNGNTTVQPTQPARNDNNGRDNRGNDNRGNNGGQPANNGNTTVQPTQPVRNDNGGRNNDNRFNNGQPNNGNNNGRPQQNTAPAVTTPQQPAPVVTPQPPRVRPGDFDARPSNNSNDQQQARPGPQSRPAPDGGVRMNPQPQQDNNQQRFQRPQPAQPQPQQQVQPQPQQRPEPQRQEQPRPQQQAQPQPQQRQEQPRPQPQAQPQQQQRPAPQAPRVQPQQPHPQPPPHEEPKK